MLDGDGRSRLTDDDIVTVFHLKRVEVPAVVNAAVKHIHLNAELACGVAHKLGHFIINGNAKNTRFETGWQHGSLVI